ncbi:hypothetical protein LOC68_08210 [Blastopirellula sp. JC732]|uniref:SLA1 homology domain-containing protein n=1 Tax=Blastopirellula sediminis TaxID=2894196 RepID=A0A9X1SEW9_9BACT|nr:SHD1 domain-containing protein [Blastopirellula sediminis]MCC9608848.1 hypothetical protein [Blastopirellula sediminis]MCC9628375.1 hypothetical protein [Blastopirellula sediminis]
MSGRMKITFLLATLIVSGLTNYAQARIWVDAEGRSVDAEFIKIEGNTVHLRRNDTGAEIEVLFAKFSEADKRRLAVLRDQAEGTNSAADDAEMPADYASSVGSDTAGDKASESKSDVSEADARRELSRSRKWTDEDGNQIQAKFVRIHDGNVILLQGNKGHNVDFYKLCDADQDYLRTQLTALGQEDDVPPVVVKSYSPSVGANGAIAGNPSGMSNFPNQFGPNGMSNPPGFSRPPGMTGPSGISSNSSSPINPNESDLDRRIREYNENFANSKLANNSANSAPPQVASSSSNSGMSSSSSSSPSYNPWANNSGSSSAAPPQNNTAPPSIRPPSFPNNPIANQPPISTPTIPTPNLQNQMVWQCKTCGTQFDTVEKPSFCHFCTSIKIGGFLLLSLVGAAIKGAMSS